MVHLTCQLTYLHCHHCLGCLAPYHFSLVCPVPYHPFLACPRPVPYHPYLACQECSLLPLPPFYHHHTLCNQVFQAYHLLLVPAGIPQILTMKEQTKDLYRGMT